MKLPSKVGFLRDSTSGMKRSLQRRSDVRTSETLMSHDMGSRARSPSSPARDLACRGWKKLCTGRGSMYSCASISLQDAPRGGVESDARWLLWGLCRLVAYAKLRKRPSDSSVSSPGDDSRLAAADCSRSVAGLLSRGLQIAALRTACVGRMISRAVRSYSLSVRKCGM